MHLLEPSNLIKRWNFVKSWASDHFVSLVGVMEMTCFELKKGFYWNRSDIPEGFHLGEVAEAHAEQINSKWRYGSPASLASFQYLLRNKFPSSGLFTTEGRLVAYILYCPDGPLFNGFVQPEYRKKGLYQVVNYDLASKVVAMGQPIPWAYAAHWNEPSLNAYKKLGAKKVEPDEYSVCWIEFQPTKTTLL